MSRAKRETVGQMVARLGIDWADWVKMPQSERSRISNVAGSGVRPDVMLCGEMFGLGVLQHRYFELGNWPGTSSFALVHPKHRGYVRGWRHGVWRDGPYVAAYGKGGGKANIDEMRAAKRIDWMTDHLSLRDAIPPAYTEVIGGFLMADLSHG